MLQHEAKAPSSQSPFPRHSWRELKRSSNPEDQLSRDSGNQDHPSVYS